MSQMLPEGGEVMRRAACGEVCPAPPPSAPARSENKELLRQQLLSASKDRLNAEKSEPPKQKHPRSRQKNRWKLKFHHQALPQEYLDHYERSLQKANARQAQQKVAKPDKPKAEPELDADNATSETFKIWAQRLAGIHTDTGAEPASPAPPAPGAAAKPPAKHDEKRRRHPAIAPSKIVTYDDLPYMGEMTLNNSKPRRGRKPKKADICHLIYENYGTVVPGQPPPGRAAARAEPAARTDLQNRIISSLLERKLSQESRRRLESPAPAPARFERPDAPRPAAPPTRAGPLHSDDEPLNLCIRDLLDLKIQIQKKFGDIYGSPDAGAGPGSPAAALSEQPNAISVIQRNTNPPAGAAGSPAPAGSPDPVGSPPPYPCWPAAGVYLHPLALHTQLLYYQRLAAAGRLPPAPGEPPPSRPASASTDASADDAKGGLVLKQISELLDPKVIERGEAARSPGRRPSPPPARAPAKRKRSAIFIPPVPPRSASSTPTTEVSICKFKFTGGSKPSLQEKKMLSVDSGGNFRYYSGTGNKGNKGYEYLQRDAARRLEAGAVPAPAPPPEDAAGKKRKSRKSLQREKLERTFKEKGFLIQTQQLQSAEGATYCKFRQLRKFTRYLFRSWKDYLPGELEERPSAEALPPRPASAAGPAPAGDWG